MDELKVPCTAPAISLVPLVNGLLLIPQHEPVEANANEVHHERQRVEDVMLGLGVHRVVALLQGVFAKVDRVVGRHDAVDQRYCGQHQRPVGEWDEEASGFHVHEIGHVT